MASRSEPGAPGSAAAAKTALPASLQRLPPAQARFCLDTLRFIEKECGLNLRGLHVLAGFSGGADSTALLLALWYLAPKLNLRLTAAHLDHGLRPSSADEAARCRAFCAKLGIPCITERRDVPALQEQYKTGLEEAARNARYDFFTKAGTSADCDWVVLGHTQNDLAEDVLMRLIRGAGWPGLAGMSACDARRKLLRPLLLTSRAAIEGFLTALGVSWLTDESNADTRFMRNRVRIHLLPALLRENPAFLDAVSGLWKLGRIDADFFAHRPAPEKPLQKADAEPVSAAQTSTAEELASLHKALRLRLYKRNLAALGPGQPLLHNLLALDSAWLSGKNTQHQFPGGKLAIVHKKNIFWTRKER